MLIKDIMNACAFYLFPYHHQDSTAKTTGKIVICLLYGITGSPFKHVGCNCAQYPWPRAFNEDFVPTLMPLVNEGLISLYVDILVNI